MLRKIFLTICLLIGICEMLFAQISNAYEVKSLDTAIKYSAYGTAIHDFRTLDRSVEQYNKKHTSTTIRVSPIYYASYDAPGIVVSVRF